MVTPPGVEPDLQRSKRCVQTATLWGSLRLQVPDGNVEAPPTVWRPRVLARHGKTQLLSNLLQPERVRVQPIIGLVVMDLRVVVKEDHLALMSTKELHPRRGFFPYHGDVRRIQGDVDLNRPWDQRPIEGGQPSINLHEYLVGMIVPKGALGHVYHA